MNRVVIGALVALVLLTGAVFYVMVIHRPRAQIDKLQRRFDRAHELLPTRWEIAEGIEPSRDNNILPVGPAIDATISRRSSSGDGPGRIDLSALMGERGTEIAREVIQDAVRTATPEVRRCYERELTRDPELTGRVVVEFRISTVGTVEHAVVRTGIRPRMDECVLDAIRNVRVEVPQDTVPATVVYPFVFDPR